MPLVTGENMASVFDYLKWRGDLKFSQDGFNDVDALILSRLSYLPFDEIVKDKEKVKIIDASNQFKKDDQREKKLLWKCDDELLFELANTERFSQLILSDYCNIVENDTQMQFSAVVIDLNEKCKFVSFRGTDNTLVGWQEDFNMFCTFPVPSQIKAVEYLENIAKGFDGELILGGHSKGGNLAVYASAFSSSSTQNKVKAIYNQDGPGFEQKVLEQENFSKFKNIIHTNVPQSSVFGMMFEHEEEFNIVKSNNKGFLQHDIYSWEIEGKKLVSLNNTTTLSVFVDHTLTQFVAQMTVDERKKFTEAVFYLLNSTENETFNEISEHIASSAGNILKSMKSLNSKDRALVLSSVLQFIKCAKNNFSDINPLKKENRQLKAKVKKPKKNKKHKKSDKTK